MNLAALSIGTETEAEVRQLQRKNHISGEIKTFNSCCNSDGLINDCIDLQRLRAAGKAAIIYCCPDSAPLSFSKIFLHWTTALNNRFLLLVRNTNTKNGLHYHPTEEEEEDPLFSKRRFIIQETIKIFINQRK